MKAKVYFSDLNVTSDKTLFDKLDILLDKVNIKEKIKEKDLIAIKLHFGEKGNTAYIRPIFLRKVVEKVKALKGKPFLTDTNTLYRGSRTDAVSHLITAYHHGFIFGAIDAPVIIADGLRGNSKVKVRIDKPIFKTASIAHEIYMADGLISVAHFKGHELSGFGGTIKNLGMGCASREGKLSQHSNISPQVKGKVCKGCEVCLNWCPSGAISMTSQNENPKIKHPIALINSKLCIGCGECIFVCPSGAIQIQWNESIPIFQKKIVEYAYGAILNKKNKTLFLNFLTQISPACDCYGFSDTPIVKDIGILSSEDPVAIDQASVDLINAEEGNPSSKLKGALAPGEDKFRGIYSEIDWSIQLSYAEDLGLGTRQYELIKI